ncbi:LPS assembly lipoprotein LptE [Prosthecochloris sp. HL-130-GSB]|jgi:hypothetical protein|uniref:LPS assembly lipoprotein LptE n=1 Tax=Prosthecochloris sp. HL-130-GSB TaxID=1974213 RepID=UPI000A1C0711|nr:LptE family protein [Prosthecochloris sp. HL-130-GSB]ARM31413.1 hypothetical protein B9H02_09040 [Prosthecochloris sp. HL-130-GSB]
MTRKLLLLPMLCLTLLVTHGCYSFTGGSVPDHITTVAVPLFTDRSASGTAQLTVDFTRQLTRRIESRSRLRIEPDRYRADAVLEGTMVSFTDEPSQLSSQTERARTNRVTIIVEAVFLDNVNGGQLFPLTSFTGFADYTAGSFSAQQDAIETSVEQISEDIFNRMVSIW